MNPVSTLVDHFFRDESARLTARLVRSFGARRLETVEDVVQETLLKAMRQWSYHGVPANPEGWLHRVATNGMLDALRREAVSTRCAVGLQHAEVSSAPPPPLEWIEDDDLRMIFTCCHPALSEESRIALTLKLMCGFSVGEIARAFLVGEPAVAQRLVRAKRTLRESLTGSAEELAPEAGELPDRMDSVLRVLYLLFNEGYCATSGDSLLRNDLCAEAIRLGRLVVNNPPVSTPEARALLALMLLHSSRKGARVDAGGDLLLLADQDRSGWDQRLIADGLAWLDRSAGGDRLSTYHLEAEIAAYHAAAPTYAETDWRAVLRAYDDLLALTGSEVVVLNRAVVVAMVYGPVQALAEIEPLRATRSLRGYCLLPATRAYLLQEAGRVGEARVEYEAALSLAAMEPERRFLRRKLAGLNQPSSRPA